MGCCYVERGRKYDSNARYQQLEMFVVLNCQLNLDFLGSTYHLSFSYVVPEGNEHLVALSKAYSYQFDQLVSTLEA